MPIKCQAEVGNVIEFANVDDNEQPYSEIKEWGKKWEQPVITYRLNNLSPDIEKHEHQVRAITVAFRVWQLRVKDIVFERTRDPDAHVDINISFRPQESFPRESILAHAWYPGQGEISGDVEINDNWDWTTGVHNSDIGHPPLIPILIHELGHSLGLVHDPLDNKSIMYPSFNLGNKKTNLGPRDVTRIQWLYGARRISQRLIDYFRKRRSLGWDFR